MKRRKIRYDRLALVAVGFVFTVALVIHLALTAYLYFTTPKKVEQHYVIPPVKEVVEIEPVIEPVVQPIEEVLEPIEEAVEEELVYIGEFKLTGYCPCYECSEEFGTATATGTTCTAGRTVAVDPTVIPYGTHLLINGHEYIAEDCGGAIKENKIDVYCDTHEECFSDYCNGYADVYIIMEA